MSHPTEQQSVQDFIEPRIGTQRFYANHINALWTPHDVSVKFSCLTKITDPPETPVRKQTYEEVAVVTLAWTETKALLLILTDIVGRYEELNGEIKTGSIP
jgi:hypothetical protein